MIILPSADRDCMVLNASRKFSNGTTLPTTGCNFAGREPVEQLRDQARMRLRLALLDLGEIDAEQGAALEQRQVERQRRNGAGGEADHQMPAAPGDRAKRLQRHFAADGIVDHVRPVAAGQRP